MAMLYDIAQALKGARTDGQSKSSAGGASSAVSVRHGTTQTVSGNWAEVLLDGSEDTTIVSCETSPAVGQRVSVVRQGGVCKVVTLGELPERMDAAQTAIGANSQAIADEVQARKEAISDARKVAENFIAQDATGALTIADMNSAAEDRNSVVVDAYGMRVQKAGEDIAVFGEVTTLGEETDFHVDISSVGMQFIDKTDTLCGTVAEYSADGKVVSGLLIKAEDWDKNIVLDTPTAIEGIDSQVIVDGEGVFIGRNECYVTAKNYPTSSASVFKATVNGTDGVELTSGGGDISARARMGSVVAVAGGTTVSLGGGKLTESGTKITSGNSPEAVSTEWARISLSRVGPLRVLVFNAQPLAENLPAGDTVLFNLDALDRPYSVVYAAVLTNEPMTNVRVAVANNGNVIAHCASALAAGRTLNGEIVWVADR